MKISKTLIEGKNCWANFDGTTRRLGFFTTRVARGRDAAQAEKVMRRKLDEDLHSLLLNNQGDLPEIIVNELTEIDLQTASSIPNAGCTWYPEDLPHPN
jgi:hypothetical protein